MFCVVLHTLITLATALLFYSRNTLPHTLCSVIYRISKTWQNFQSFKSNHPASVKMMLQTVAYAVAAAAALSVLLSLSAKGLLRDDGEFEDWCAQLHPWWRGVAMSVYRCVHASRLSNVEDDDAEDDVYDVPPFKNEDGSVNVDWLWMYIARKEASDEKKDALIAQQAEYIERLLHRERARVPVQSY